MFRWFSNLFKRKWVEVKPNEYKTKHIVNGKVCLVPDPKWKMALRRNSKGEPSIVYLKQVKVDSSGLPKNKR